MYYINFILAELYGRILIKPFTLLEPYNAVEPSRQKVQKRSKKHTTVGFRWWTSTQLLIHRCQAFSRLMLRTVPFGLAGESRRRHVFDASRWSSYPPQPPDGDHVDTLEVVVLLRERLWTLGFEKQPGTGWFGQLKSIVRMLVFKSYYNWWRSYGVALQLGNHDLTKYLGWV